ncbi:CAP domain-containing protein [Chytridium lagenaria]|nr:CAP domain-containing protein [Chytridium lagenaria]
MARYLVALVVMAVVVGCVEGALSPLSKQSGKGRYLRHLNPSLTDAQVKVVNECPWRWQVKQGDTCGSIAVALGTDEKLLTSNNPGLDCLRIKKNDILCLSKTIDSPISNAIDQISTQQSGASDNATFTCTQNFTTTGSENCIRIKDINNVYSLVYLVKINPTLECFKGNVTAGTDVCVKSTLNAEKYKDPVIPRGSIPIPVADCNKTVSISRNSTCDHIAEDANLRPQVLFELNANLTCTKLTDNIGSSVCVSSTSKFFNQTTSPASPTSGTNTMSTTNIVNSPSSTENPTPTSTPAEAPTPSPDTPQVPTAPSSPGEAGACLAYHNAHRMRIYGNDASYLLSWDENLVASARDIAQSLADRNCDIDHGGRQGENLAATRGYGEDGWCTGATGGWIGEGFNGDNYNHASQLSWSTVKNVGCAMVYSQAYDCRSIVCRYDPIGNFIGVGYSPTF